MSTIQVTPIIQKTKSLIHSRRKKLDNAFLVTLSSKLMLAELGPIEAPDGATRSDWPLVDQYAESHISGLYDVPLQYSVFNRLDQSMHRLVCTTGYFYGSLSALALLTLHLREIHIVGRPAGLRPSSAAHRQLSLSECLQILLPSTVGLALRCELTNRSTESIEVPIQLWAPIQGILPELDNLIPVETSEQRSTLHAVDSPNPEATVRGYMPYRVSRLVQTAVGTFFRFAESKLPLRATQLLGKLVHVLPMNSRYSNSPIFHSLPPLTKTQWFKFSTLLQVTKPLECYET
jgi:hypothetical protein